MVAKYFIAISLLLIMHGCSLKLSLLICNASDHQLRFSWVTESGAEKAHVAAIGEAYEFTYSEDIPDGLVKVEASDGGLSHEVDVEYLKKLWGDEPLAARQLAAPSGGLRPRSVMWLEIRDDIRLHWVRPGSECPSEVTAKEPHPFPL